MEKRLVEKTIASVAANVYHVGGFFEPEESP
jgi:hypothetical protein